MTFWEATFRVAMAAGAIVQTAFVLVYATRPWRSLAISRALMTKSASLCACLLAIEVHFYLQPLPKPVWAIAATMLALAIARQFWVLVRAGHYDPNPRR